MSGHTIEQTRVRRPEVDDDWSDLASEYVIRPGTTYLNHGSFGIAPRSVRESRRHWIDAVDSQPMDIFVRRFEPELVAARTSLAAFVGTETENLVFVENATFGMNVVANFWPLGPGRASRAEST